jgi:hypothetical protein
MREHERDSPKVNVWCDLMHDRIISPFFFAEKTVTANVYLDMLEQFVISQLREQLPNIMLQQDGAPPHWSLLVRKCLDRHFPGRWIGRDEPIAWPLWSPDITPLDFFMWGYVKDIIYANPVLDLQDLCDRITNAISTVTSDMLKRIWIEIDY